MSWQEQTAMMSPKQERAFWLQEVKNRMTFCTGLLVNRRYMPSLDKTPVLRKLVEDGLLVRVRQYTWNSSSVRRTYLVLPE
ncbi:hypothetical protein phiPsa267_002 [Pseudomonas phage phiPsa267]|uniref:Uncharacterized protein n=2 Tax=Otagovirus TaxID=2560197 RepID=A0A7G9V119_9CAUD|nr:hypothetical protein QGX18_gp002 [Pseudomonas phage phiPsa347]YP_010767612.1 hypothetical protein QGX19_gp002 [Pseudomonas phage phiPsa267]QNN99974.1 hypothetical protein phiPsa267_002 [Pseudomonas phage phiPsa267]QNO00494.1 hypothetical protein phiPsa347_002 [Pseudomonas phage phiPsa347]